MHPFVGGENIAQFVAYAVSVQQDTSSQEAIQRIGFQLGEYTAKVASVRRVSAPLLGAGAGGLQSEVVAAALSKGFQQSSHKDATLIINVLHESVFQRIQNSLALPSRSEESHLLTTAPPKRPPRVFISYSHTSPEHEKWVEILGEFLRQNGVDARMDAWHLRRGMDIPQFMTNELTLADRVVMVSDEKYAEKADGRVGGVGWETMLIQGDISRLSPESTKYLVVVRSDKVDDGLPQYLKTKFVIHWHNAADDEKNRGLLLREIFDAIRVPPLGRRPTFL